MKRLLQSSAATVLRSFCVLIAVATASAQTLQLNPADMLKGSGIGQAQPATASVAPATATAAPEAPPAAASGLPAPATAPDATVPASPQKVAQGYLYVEPYQARFEAMFDAERFLRWLNPLKELPAELDAAAQKAACEAAHKQVQDWCHLSANGTRVEGAFLGVSVIKGKPGATLPMKADETLPLNQALFGLMWEFPTPPGPDEVIAEWHGFFEEISTMPIRVFFGSKSETLEVSRVLPKASWKSQGRLPLPTPLAKVPQIVVVPGTKVPLASIIWGLGGLLFFIFVRIHERHLPGGSLPFLCAWILGAVLSWPLLNISFGGGAEIPTVTEKKEAEKILTPLLRNVYRAFDYRNESEIYDVLARSVDGELLRKLYLETIQALTLEGREGTRVTISEFSADVMGVEPLKSGPGFVSDCQWTAMGTVGHWGHSHTRVNRYNAKVTISPVENAWKLTALDVTEARRL
ncbi:hypothetical protein [Brevifollis gellanilyticus]|uniref:hypothetical protein n=1 Tax=Brevifollis gellanilyticus TaxID=748831 RepID=UPI0011BE2A81|nr:hypothetical protein [Brevifollis gellanilyticus]